jgi:hypothetical protein
MSITEQTNQYLIDHLTLTDYNLGDFRADIFMTLLKLSNGFGVVSLHIHNALMLDK